MAKLPKLPRVPTLSRPEARGCNYSLVRDRYQVGYRTPYVRGASWLADTGPGARLQLFSMSPTL